MSVREASVGVRRRQLASVAVTGVCRAVTGGEERSSSGRGEWSLRGGGGV